MSEVAQPGWDASIACECEPANACTKTVGIPACADCGQHVCWLEYLRWEVRAGQTLNANQHWRVTSAVRQARRRLISAAIAIGDCHLAGIDPGWNESNEVEQASIHLTMAIRAEHAVEGK